MGHMMSRHLLTPLIFFIALLPPAQALAFDAVGLSYNVINATDVEVTGRASGNTDTDIVIPATVSDSGTIYVVRSIGDDAFYDSDLTTVTIGNSVTIIGERAFAENALTSLTIGNSVTTIGKEAFGRNRVLTSVTIGNSVATIGERAFSVNDLASAAFEGNFGAFSPDMFDQNPELAKITYCEGTSGWPLSFGTAEIATTPTDCRPSLAAKPVPVGPLWLLSVMASLLSLMAVRKLRKA